METRELILASLSPRRRELMSYTGLPFRVLSADAQEKTSGAPMDVARENAMLKARAVFGEHPEAVVLAADTVVDAGEQALGKPRDAEDAKRMLRLLSGAWHEVRTGVCLLSREGEQTRVVSTRVKFTELTQDTIDRYVRSGEPMDKAGAYALQGRGGLYVERIEGSYTNVIGLPMETVRAMLMRAGYAL